MDRDALQFAADLERLSQVMPGLLGDILGVEEGEEEATRDLISSLLIHRGARPVVGGP